MEEKTIVHPSATKALLSDRQERAAGTHGMSRVPTHHYKSKSEIHPHFPIYTSRLMQNHMGRKSQSLVARDCTWGVLGRRWDFVYLHCGVYMAAGAYLSSTNCSPK